MDASSLLTEQILANHDDNHQDVARVIKVITAELPPTPVKTQQEKVKETEESLVDETFSSAIDESVVANGTANGYTDDTKYDDFEQVEWTQKANHYLSRTIFKSLILLLLSRVVFICK